uniref:sodium:solute symporter family transporter n=1 Tax=Fusobacterium mortiferum TaxID=850 RepID=UPI003FEF1947
MGWAFRNFSKDTSDYFKGGGKMLWWMVGATAFMTQFSAWTFTGAAGQAFRNGLSPVVLFLGNALGYFFNYLFFAAKARQMRVVTPIEGIRMRYGKVSEQVFIWANVPTSILQAGIWLNALAIFVAAVFEISMPVTIIITGIVVVVMSATGGAWAVVASDFLQMLVVMAVSIVAAGVAIIKSDGITPIFQNGLPEGEPFGPGYFHIGLLIAWIILTFTKQFFSTNNMIDSYRYLCAKDTKNARKAALLACGLMLIGPFIWFIPNWFVAATNPNPELWNLANLGKNIKDASYYVFVKNELPAGMVGLMMAAMCAATMSSMDSALNRNAGIFARNFYKVLINKNADEEKLLDIGKKTTFVFGAIIIATGVFLNNLKGISLFDMILMISSLLALPVLIPSILGYFVKETPDWAGWATILVGGLVSAFIMFGITPELIEKVLQLSEPLTTREFAEMKSLTLGMGLHLCITIPFYFLTKLFYKGYTPERKKEIEEFFENISTEVIAEENPENDEFDNQQRGILGKIILAFGASGLILVLVPNPLSGRLVFVAVCTIIMIVGWGLYLSSKPKK